MRIYTVGGPKCCVRFLSYFACEMRIWICSARANEKKEERERERKERVFFFGNDKKKTLRICMCSSTEAV